MDKEELKAIKPPTIYAVGYLVEETKDWYKLAGQICSDGDIGDIFTILKSTKIKLKKLISK
jgi:hypothetical protein